MKYVPAGMWLSEDDVAKLRSEGPWGDGTWPDVDPDEVAYGAPLEELFERFVYPADFLQAVALAGRVNRSVLGRGARCPALTPVLAVG